MTHRIARLRRVRSAVPAAALWAAAACLGTGGLTGGADSMDSLAEQYVAAVAAGDTAAMHVLRVTETEHNERLWPEFPASRPEMNMPVEFAWQNIERASRRDAARLAGRFQGHAYRLGAVQCRGGTTEYASFHVHGDCWLRLAGAPPGMDPWVKWFGSIVEWDGRFKIIGIIAD